jgi:hypothetical protein
MKRPAGVTASAVILAILSLLQIVFGLCMALAGTMSHEKGSPAAALPGWVGIVMYELSAIFLIFAVWGIATAIGLNRLRRWARFSTIIIGGLMALCGLLMMLGGLIAFVAPQLSSASTASTHLQSAQLLVRVILGVTELIYAAIAGVGIWWLIYFNRRHVREAFATPVELPVHPPTAA